MRILFQSLSRLNRLCALAAMSALFAVSARAAEEGAEAGGGGLLESLGIEPKTLLLQLFAFGLMYVLLRKFLWGPVLSLMEVRKAEVARIYDDADKARATAEQERKQYEDRLASADEEAREHVKTAMTEAARMKDEIISAAREQADRIMAAGRDEVRREREKALAELRDTIVTLAVGAAGSIVRQKMDPAVQRSLVDDFISRTSGRPQ